MRPSSPHRPLPPDLCKSSSPGPISPAAVAALCISLSAVFPGAEDLHRFLAAVHITPSSTLVVPHVSGPPHISRVAHHAILDALRLASFDEQKKEPRAMARDFYNGYPIIPPPEGIIETIQGGATISGKAYQDLLHFYNALDDANLRIRLLLTGSGPGTMQAPLEARAKRKIKVPYDDRYGVTEGGILAKELTNSYVQILRVARDIYQRMMIFLAPVDLVRFHEGGAGTLQEMITFFQIALHKDNIGIAPPGHAVGMFGNDTMKHFEEFFQEFLSLGNTHALRFFHDVHPKNPSTYLSEYEALLSSYTPQQGIYRPDLFFPDTVLSPPRSDHEALSRLSFSQDMSQWDLLSALNTLFHGVVEYSIKRPQEMPDALHISGDAPIIRALENLFDRLYKEKRIPGRKFLFFHAHAAPLPRP